VSIRRDYKSTAPGQHRQSARRHGLLVITLVLIGLFGGLLAYIKGDRTHPAPTTATAAPTAPAAAPPKVVAAPVVEPAPVKPKYDFYTELPKRQIDIRRETVNPRNAPQPSPTRIQPVADPLRKPAAPRKDTASKTPTMATTSGAKPNAKTANSKTPDAKTANSKTPDAKTTNSKTANSKTSDAKTANSKTPDAKTANSKTPDAKTTNSKTANSKTPDAKTANSKTANSKTPDAKTTPATAPARTAQPARPLANSGSNIAVKIE
jgi:hypothetical protein